MTTAMPSPVAADGVADRVEHQVGEGGDPAEPGGVPAGVDLDLQPAAAVAHVVLGRLQHQPADVGLGPQHRPGHVVEPLEPEPALLVGRRQLAAATRETSGSGSAMPSRSASSSSVACRIDPVKCRCRCAFGRARRSRGPSDQLRRRASAAG